MQVILETLGGGGHLTMAGAQLRDVDRDTAHQMIFDAIRKFRTDEAQKKEAARVQED